MELEGPRGQNGLPFPWSRGGTWTVCPSCGSAEQVMTIQLWVRLAPSPGSGPSSQMQGEGRGPLSHVLSRPSFLAAAVFFPSHCQLRERYSLSRCGSHYCRLPRQTGPRGCNVVTMLNARPRGQMSPCGWLTMNPYVPLSSGPQALWLDSVLYIWLILLSGYWWLKGISYTFPFSLQTQHRS